VCRACPGEGRGQTIGARGRALCLGAKSRPRRQGAGDAATPAATAMGAAQATVDDAADARGAADETWRRARPVAHRLAPGRHRGRRRQRHIQLSARSRQAAASPLARRSLSVAHQPRRGRPGQAVEPLPAAGGGRGGVQEPQEPAPAKAGGDLAIRPVFHQLEARVEAHVFISFLAYCLHVTLARRLHALAPGLTPRSVLEKFAAVQMIDLHLPTTAGRELVLIRYTEPEPEVSLLLKKLRLDLPAQPPPKITASAPAPPTPL